MLLVAGAAPVLTPWFFISYFRPTTIRQWCVLFWKTLGVALIGWALFVFLWAVIFATLTADIENKIEEYKGIQSLLFSASGSALFLIVLRFITARVQKLKRLSVAAVSFSLLVIIISFSYELAFDFYDHVPEALGGGKPMSASLILTKEGVEFWNQIGGEFLCKCASTGAVLIMYQNEREVVLLTTHTETELGKWFKRKPVILNKSLVNGIIPYPSKVPETK